MTDPVRVPEATLLRLSRYHCFTGELLRSGRRGRIRSSEIAQELGVSQETVRRDLSYADVDGRPGAGYDLLLLLDSLERFLDLSSHHPFIAIANKGMLENLAIMFPAEKFGLRPEAYFSDEDEDAGHRVDGLTVATLADLPAVAESLEATVAVVACKPDSVGVALDALKAAGIMGVLMLTPVLRPHHPEGMNITYFRIPCALKSLVSSEAPSCCGTR